MIVALLSLARADSFIVENAGLTIHRETALVLDSWAGGERMEWWGSGTLTVTAPDSTETVLEPGYDLNLDQVGQWLLELERDQDESFSIPVYSAGNVRQLGRLHSTAWIVSVADAGWLEQYFFIPVPQHAEPTPWPDDWEGRLVKARLEGLYGDEMVIVADRQGADEAPLQSIETANSSAEAELPLYLNFPDRIEPTAPGTDAGALEVKWSSELCEVVAPGISSVELTLDTALRGQVVFGCSLDETVDLSAADGDVIAAGGMGPGYAGWMFSGQDTLEWGLAPPGTYTCGAQVLESPLHLLIAGADAADPGVRLYETVEVGSYQSQAMFWNDQRLDDGTTALASGAAGVASGAYEDAGVAGGNAHGWGSRGSAAWIDTWSALSVVSSETVQVVVLDPEQDTDQDGLPDAEEACLYGTDSDDGDTDGDGIADGDEVSDGTDPLDPEDPGSPDKIGSEDDKTGNVTGGACRCAATGAAAQGAWLAVAAALVGWRRRER